MSNTRPSTPMAIDDSADIAAQDEGLEAQESNKRLKPMQQLAVLAEARPLPRLPDEMWQKIIASCDDPRDVAIAGEVCKFFKTMTRDKNLRDKFTMFLFPPRNYTAEQGCEVKSYTFDFGPEANRKIANVLHLGYDDVLVLLLDGSMHLIDLIKNVVQEFAKAEIAKAKHVKQLDSDRIVTSGEDGVIRIWDVKTKACVMQLQGHQQEVTSLTVTPDKKIISGSLDNTARLWIPDNHQYVCHRVFSGHGDGVRNVNITADGKYIITSNKHGWLRLWNIESGLVTSNGMLRHFTTGLSAFNSVITIVPNSYTFLFASELGHLGFWRVNMGMHSLSLITQFAGFQTRYAETAYGKIVSCNYNGQLQFLEPRLKPDGRYTIDSIKLLSLQPKANFVNVMKDGRIMCVLDNGKLQIYSFPFFTPRRQVTQNEAQPLPVEANTNKI